MRSDSLATDRYTMLMALGLLGLMVLTNMPHLGAASLSSSPQSNSSVSLRQSNSTSLSTTNTSTSTGGSVVIDKTLPCGSSLPNDSALVPAGNYAGASSHGEYVILSNGTTAAMPSNCPQVVPGMGTTGWTTVAEADVGTSGATQTPTTLSNNFCTTSTSCTLTASVTKYDLLIIATQSPSGSSPAVYLTDSSSNSWTTLVTYTGGTAETVDLFSANASATGSDTFTVHDSVSGTMALEGYEASGSAAYSTYVSSSNSCTSSCSTSIHTATSGFLQSAFLVTSVYAAPGSGGAAGSSFNLNQATSNSFRAAEEGVSTYSSGPTDPTTFPITDGATPTSWVEVGVSFAEPSYTSVDESFTVPTAPTNTAGFACAFPTCTGASALKYVSYWYGIEDPNTGSYGGIILQPLVTYGCAGTNGVDGCGCAGASWYMSDWAQGLGPLSCSSESFDAVSSGDSITATVTFYGSNSNCPSSDPGYTVYIKDNTATLTLINYVCTGDGMPLGSGAVLEQTTNITTCNQMPGQTSGTFSSITLTPANGGQTPVTSYGNQQGTCGNTNSNPWNAGRTSATIDWKDS